VLLRISEDDKAVPMGTHMEIRTRSRGASRRFRAGTGAVVALAGLTLVALTTTIPGAYAATSVGLGTADSYVVLGGESVTNTGPSVLGGDLGVSPGTSITGFPPGTVVGGTTHTTDAHAQQAQVDVTTA
jgi:type VI secretion system secreted protein VgrG